MIYILCCNEEYKMKVTIEETLASTDVVTALTDSPYLIYSEILEGMRRPLAFLQVVKEIKDLIGETGNRYQFLTADQLSAAQNTEAYMLTTGMSGAAQKNLDAVDISVTDIIWSATQLSDFLKEDFPKIDWVQTNLKNLGLAVMEFLDALVYSTIKAASGTETYSCAALDYDEVNDALTEAKDEDWIPDAMNPPFLIMSSGAANALLKEVTPAFRADGYSTDKLAKMVAGEVGLYAGCKVLETSLLAGTGDAYIVFPDGAGGPVVALIWKRELKVTNIYVPQNGYTYFNSSIRAIPVVVQAKGIVKISITGSP